MALADVLRMIQDNEVKFVDLRLLIPEVKNST